METNKTSPGLEVVHSDETAPEVYQQWHAPPSSAHEQYTDKAAFLASVRPEHPRGQGDSYSDRPITAFQHEHTGRRPRRSTILWLSAAIALIVALAVGMGVGITTASQHCSKTSTTTSSLPASTPTATPGSSTMPTSLCPAIDRTTYSSNLTSRSYEIVCNTILSTNLPRHNLVSFVAWTMNDCVSACDAYNQWGNASTPMNVVTWSWEGVGQGGAETPGSCWCLSAGNYLSAGPQYTMTEFQGQDSALLKGTFDESVLPSPS